MQKQQYTLFLTRDDGTTRSIRFCAATLRLLVILCFATPVIALTSLYFAMQCWQDATILSHKNDELRYELQVYQNELQKYATIQKLVTSYEQEASPILMASKAVPSPVPYDIEVQEENIEARNKDIVAEQKNTAEDTQNPDTSNDGAELDSQNEKHTAQEEQDQNNVTPATPEHSVTDIFAQKNTADDAKSSTESILQPQNQSQGIEEDGYTVITDYKAKLTDIIIHEDSSSIQVTLKLSNATETAIAGHLYVVLQGHDKKLYPIHISEKFTAFNIQRYRHYTLNCPLPSDLKAADIDKIIISAKTRAGEILYCNAFAIK